VAFVRKPARNGGHEEHEDPATKHAKGTKRKPATFLIFVTFVAKLRGFGADPAAYAVSIQGGSACGQGASMRVGPSCSSAAATAPGTFSTESTRHPRAPNASA